jgi:arylsulfatase A-like enzyme/Tfp pilus assembly protein PilF
MARLAVRWRLLLLAAALLAAGSLVALWSRATRPLNVLIISIDTLRADRLGAYGYAKARTPALDALAARGARFERAFTVMPLTLPAHTSLFTGTFPAFHGVRDNGGFYVDEERDTLAELLAARGYRTGAVVAAFVLDGRWGLEQGFDTYYDNFDLSKDVPPGMDMIQRPGREVVDRSIEWLQSVGDAPFFAWVHLYDPHAPYEAPEPYRSSFPRTLDGAYDAEVASTDAEVARLLAALDADGRLDDTLVVVIGDHGESLGQHGEQAHGFFIYESVLHVPFILAGPGIEPRIVPDQVRIVDVMPTLLDLLGLPHPAATQGVTLVPTLSGGRIDLPAFAETWYPRYHYGWSELMSLRDGRYKFILAPTRELYDLEQDPGELENLAASNPERAAAAERSLRDMLERISSAEAATGPRTIDPAVEERLRALGYVGASVSRRNLEDRPRGDPKDKIGLYNLLKLAGNDATENRLDEAVAKVRQVLADDPDIVEGYTQLGNLYTKLDRHEAAADAYKQALSLDPEHRQATFSLALVYRRLGRLEEAELGFARVRELDPRDGRSLFQLADLRMGEKRFAEAAEALERGLELDVERAPFLVKLGEAYIELGRLDDARRRLTEALTAQPTIERAQFNLGLVYEAQGQRAEAATSYEAELAHNPMSYGAAFNLGKLRLGEGRTKEAVDRFRLAVEARPAFAEGHLYLAKAWLDVGNLSQAEEAARRGLSQNPDPTVAPLGHYVLADVYSRLGRERDAAREVEAARKLERRVG